MVRSSNCSTYGVPKKVYPCSKCETRRNNALMRGGGNRSKRKGTDRKEHDTKGHYLVVVVTVSDSS